MLPRSIHHVFPYHTRQIADDDAGWWSTQLGAWPVAACLRGADAARTVVHVIGDGSSHDDRLLVHTGAPAGPAVLPFGYDLSLPMLRALRRLGPEDVCVIHGADSPAASLCAEAARSARIVVVYHGGSTGGPDRLKDLAARHVVLRPEVATTLAADGYDPTTIVEVQPSIDSDFLRVERAPQRPGEVRVGFVGRPTWGKGVDAIVPTVERLRRDGFEVFVDLVGATHLDDVTILAAAVQDLGGRLRSHGFIPNPEMPVLMAQWDVLCSPSRWEGFSRSLLEATAVGVPVVCVAGVMPERAVDGDRVRGVERDAFPEAVSQAVGSWRSRTMPRRAHTHHEGAADFDRIVRDLGSRSPRPAPDPMSTVRALGQIVRRYEPLLQRGRPSLRLVRSVRGLFDGTPRQPWL